MKKHLFASVFAFLLALLITSTACNNSGGSDKKGLITGTTVKGISTSGDTGTGGGTTPGDTGVIIPGDTGSTTPGDTGSTTPGDTGSTTPGDTGSTTPGDTGSTTPGDTGSTTPGDTGSTTPGDTGSTTPGDTGSTTPGDTGSTTPGDTGGTTPVDTLRLVFVGDIMMARKVATIVSNSGANNYQYCYQYVADYLRTADLAFANLESIITDAGTADAAKLLQGLAFRAIPAAVNGLTYAGIDVVSVANNHAFDYARAGFNDSLVHLKAAGITPVGGGSFEEAYTAKVFDVKGTKVAILAFTLSGVENTDRAQKTDAGLVAQTGIAWFYTKYVNPAIIAAKKVADIVVVSIHFGTEYATLPDVYQDKYAHQCIDQGAHLVIGHHPHVIQPVMAYAKGFIAHSLGNFIFDQSDTATKRGMILEVLVRNKKIYQVNRKYVQINNNYQPVIQ